MRQSTIFETLPRAEQRRSIDTLQKCTAVLRQRRFWTRYVFARDARGHSVPYDSPRAICFCAVGVIRKIAGDSSHALRLCSCLEEFADGVALQTLNDQAHGQQVVVTLFEAFLATYEAATLREAV